MKRTHLVLVPGFGGFDALGQMHYYTGVTKRFHDWAGDRDIGLELHYFDNLPTAAVATRARDLEDYLDKQIDRRAIGLLMIDGGQHAFSRQHHGITSYFGSNFQYTA